MTDENGKDLEVDIPHGKLRARGYDLLTILVAAALGLMLYMLFEHTKIAEVSAKDAAVNAKETSRAIREMTCVLSVDQSDRMNQLGRQDSFCKRMAQ